MKYGFKKLKRARIDARLTQTELAQLAGVSVAAVNQVELGKGPWVKAIRKIEDALATRGVPINAIKTRRSA